MHGRVIEAWLRLRRLGNLGPMRRLARLVGLGRLAGFGPRRTVVGVLAAVALASSGCSGGQTGEITEPTLCERVTEALSREELPSEIGAAFDAAERPTNAALEWSDADGATTTLHLTLGRDGTAVERLGSDTCPPSWRASFVVQLRTDDGRLDATLDGTATVRELASETSSTVIAEAALASLHLDDADVAVTADSPDATVRLSAEHDSLGWRGTLFLQDADEERVLAVF